ncbi:MAG TPA: 1-(5-phosphoribosyl)-5-[(5-phosphoribosylamino)methylideneamino] imidazole-4-carboxamide isomerase [candidate division Zixibacteria bacterium]|nr:1-(5-phosphoribosyl)-5-[(5-phosphoribosylamino)methylideneamino] imidazole-4-carboxamide isomerase [candidate division Zixibacteria bacterium]
MDLIPAIDLLEGRAVRLEQGDFSRPVLDADPEELAQDWLRRGVRHLHVVDLAGARDGARSAAGAMARVMTAARAARPDAWIEVAGGLRTLDAVAEAFAAGADVVILGTAALPPSCLVADAAARWPGRIGAALDLRDGHLAVDGWTRAAAGDPFTLAPWLVEQGASRLVVTDVRRDGTATGPNLELMARLRGLLPDVRLVASGGIGSAADLRALAELGVDGAVVGRALVDGSLAIEEALAACLAEVRG